LEKALDELYRLGLDNVDKLPNILWIWAVMPLRHKKNQTSYILSSCWKRYEECEDDKSLLKRFLNATYNSIDKRFNLYEDYGFHFNLNAFSKQLHTYSNVLEYPLFTLPITTSTNSLIYKEFERCLKGFNEVVICLSGGVDSMVCFHSIYQIPFIKNIKVFHMNYCNRGIDSQSEECFIKSWCSYHQIPYVIRKFDEITRERCMNNNMRHLYESYTKRIKMDIIKSFGNLPIIYGHNKDDKFENILTNISRNQKYENLEGMKEYDGNIIRPLLNISKEEIFNHAHKYKIPYFKNNTPSWSQRGMIRDIVCPSLNRWNATFTDSMHEFVKDVSDMVEVENYYIELLMKNNKISDNYYEFRISEFNKWNDRIWHGMLSYLNIKYSKKSFKNMIDNVKLHSAYRKIHLNKNTKLIVYKDDTKISIKIDES